MKNSLDPEVVLVLYHCYQQRTLVNYESLEEHALQTATS